MSGRNRDGRTPNANFWDDIKKQVGDEKILSVMASGQEALLSEAEAKALLDYDYSNTWGGSDCHPIWLWTETRVFFVSVYDGKTWLDSVPRNPVVGEPEMYGGE